MRYFGSDRILFTDLDGREHNIIEPQEIVTPALQYGVLDAGDDPVQLVILRDIDITDRTEIDEVAQRRDVYGRGSEHLWYRLFDGNAANIVDNDWDIKGLKKLKVPQL